LTSSNYPALNVLQDKYAGSFDVIGFPCNAFGMQEMGGTGEEIWNSIKYVRPGGGYEPNFQLSEKLEVTGENSHPLFTFLRNVCPSPLPLFFPKEGLFYTGMDSSDIRWNFEKFLIGKDGIPVKIRSVHNASRN